MAGGVHYLVRIQREQGELAYQWALHKVATRWVTLILTAVVSALWLIFGG